MLDLRNGNTMFTCLDKNGEPSVRMYSEEEIDQLISKMKSGQNLDEEYDVIHKKACNTLLELLRQLNQCGPSSELTDDIYHEVN